VVNARAPVAVASTSLPIDRESTVDERVERHMAHLSVCPRMDDA
jgi:hypothetical protein